MTNVQSGSGITTVASVKWIRNVLASVITNCVLNWQNIKGLFKFCMDFTLRRRIHVVDTRFTNVTSMIKECYSFGKDILYSFCELLYELSMNCSYCLMLKYIYIIRHKNFYLCLITNYTIYIFNMYIIGIFLLNPTQCFNILKNVCWDWN